LRAKQTGLSARESVNTQAIHKQYTSNTQAIRKQYASNTQVFNFLQLSQPMFAHHFKFSWLMALCMGCSGLSFSAQADELTQIQRLHESGQTSSALQRADQLLLQRPKDAQILFFKGVMLAGSQRGPEAMALFEQLTQDYPDLAEPYNNLATLYAASGNYAKACVALEQALSLNPDYATAHENLGDIHAALAAESYARALKLEPRSTSVPMKLNLARELYKNPTRTGIHGQLNSHIQ
jgi:tetratricopeptide (TPR) repeat protein